MTLILPRAGTNPGRAARAVAMPADQSGDAIAGLGDIMANLGTVMVNDQLDRQLKRAQVDMTRDVNDLRLEIEQIGDPDQADARWTQGISQIKTSYIGPERKGTERLDGRRVEDFELAFDQLANRTGFGVGRRNVQLRMAEHEATYIDYAHEATRAAAGADPDTRAVLIAQGDQQIASMLEAGVIDAAEAEKRRIALRGDISNTRAMQLVAEDPQAFLDEADQGGFPGLEADTLKRYELSAKANIETARKEAEKEAEKARTERQKAIGERLSEMREIMGAGRQAVDEAFLSSTEVKQHPEYARTMAAYSLREENQQLAHMTPAQIDALIAGEKTKKVAHEWQTERLEILQDWRDRHADGYRKDSVAWARQNNVPEPGLAELPAFDPGDPAAFGEALTARAEAMANLAEDGYPVQGRLLDDNERAMLREAASLDNDPETRAELALTLARNLPRNSVDALSDVIDDPVFTHVGGLIDDGAGKMIGAEILRGQQVIEEKNVVMPPVKDRSAPVFGAIGAYFADVPGGEQLQSSLTKAADALYAARVRRSDPAGDIDEDVYRQALHEVMGGTGAYHSRTAKGGMQDVRGRLTPLPRGIGERDVEAALDALSDDLDGVRSAKYPEAVEAAQRDARQKFNMDGRPITRLTSQEARARADAMWQTASRSGGQPGIAGEPIDANTLSALSLKGVGPDTYRLVDETGAVVSDLMSGAPYEFSLTRLIEGYAR